MVRFIKALLEFAQLLEYDFNMDCLKEYQKAALKLAEIKRVESEEGYSARIPGFHGLIVFGSTKLEAWNELESALKGWIEVALARGKGLPSLHHDAGHLATAR